MVVVVAICGYHGVNSVGVHHSWKKPSCQSGAEGKDGKVYICNQRDVNCELLELIVVYKCI